MTRKVSPFRHVTLDAFAPRRHLCYGISRTSWTGQAAVWRRRTSSDVREVTPAIGRATHGVRGTLSATDSPVESPLRKEKMSVLTARTRFRLGVRVRRGVLALHVIAAGAWIGIDVMIAVLVGVGRFGDDPAARSAAYEAIGRFAVTPMLTAALACLATGLLLGLATKWGLVRYWWVLSKLVITVALCILIVVALRPGMDEVTAAGVAIGDDRRPVTDLDSHFFPPAVSLTALSAAVVLSAYKPWGRIRRRTPHGVRQRTLQG